MPRRREVRMELWMEKDSKDRQVGISKTKSAPICIGMSMCIGMCIGMSWPMLAALRWPLKDAMSSCWQFEVRTASASLFFFFNSNSTQLKSTQVVIGYLSSWQTTAAKSKISTPTSSSSPYSGSFAMRACHSTYSITEVAVLGLGHSNGWSGGSYCFECHEDWKFESSKCVS